MTADRGVRTGVALIATVAILAALHFASSVFAPLAFALFIIAIVWPLQSALQSRLPRLVALAMVMLGVVLVFMAFASLIVWGFGRVAQGVVSDEGQFQLIYERVAAWLDDHGIAVAGLWAEHFNVMWVVRAVQDITGRLNTTLTFWLVVLVYVILGLLEVDDAGRRVRAMENREAARILLDGSNTTAVMLRRYMLVRTVMSVMTGVLVAAFATLVGLQFAAEWGVIAFALNYIPFIGPFIATLFPSLFALAEFQSWKAALAIFAGLNVIQFVIGSYIEPRVSGTTLALAPVVVLFAVFFWTFMWGVFGAFIGLPITIAVLAFCAEHASSRWLADLLGAGPGTDRPP